MTFPSQRQTTDSTIASGPSIQQPRALAAQPSRNAGKLLQEPLNILLVEDNKDHAELIARSFDDQTLAAITHVSDGETALDYLFRREPYNDDDEWPMPQMVLLDLRLPKVDGLDVLHRLRSSGQFDDIPVVILTTSHAEADVEQAYHWHVNSYLVKPLDFDDFSRLMTDLGDYWLRWNRYPWQSTRS